MGGGEEGDGGARRVPSGKHITAPASCQGPRGLWEAPSGQRPTLLSSESITTVPCAPPGSSVLPQGPRVREPAELLSAQTCDSSEGQSHVGTRTAHTDARMCATSRRRGGETPLGSTVTNF